jgi:hypothetical protein
MGSSMTEAGNDRSRISRRAALAGLGAAAAAAVRPAAAQQKIDQTLAKYQATPNGDQHCGLCSNFQAPNACQFVQGDISPNGWCQLFSPRT